MTAGDKPEASEATTDAYRLCDSAYGMYKAGKFATAEKTFVHALYEKDPLPWTKAALLYNLGLIASEARDGQTAYSLFRMSLEVRPVGVNADKVASECAKLNRGSCIYTRDADGRLK